MTTGKTKTSSIFPGLFAGLMAFALFSSHDVIVKLLGETYSVFQILFFAGLFSFVPMTLVMSTDKAVDNFIPNNPMLIACRAALNVIGMAAAFYAFTVLPLTEVYALIFVTPLLITILAIPLLGETIRLQRGLAVIAGLVGVIVVLRPGVSEFTLGHAAALVAAVAGAFGALIVRKLGREERTAVIVLYPMFASIIVMGALQAFDYQPLPFVHLVFMAVIGVLAIIGQFLIVNAYQRAPAAVVAPMQYTQILWATLYGYLFFNELPDQWVAIGASIIILSGVFIVWRESRSNVSEVNPILRTPNVRPDTGPSPKPKLFQRMRPRALKKKSK